MVLFVLMGNFVIGQSKPKMTKLQILDREWEWDRADIKTLLEKKADESKVSKPETQKWIIDKLNSYIVSHYELQGKYMYHDPITKKPFYEYETYDIISKNIYFSNKYLVLNFNFKITSLHWPQPKFKDRTDSICISDLSNVTFKFQEMTFEYLPNSEREYSYALKFDDGRETDIRLRMRKAFVHLCSFYWHKVKNESF